MRRGAGVECEKSTVMFAYFAQWFTDGFLRSDRSPQRDPRRKRHQPRARHDAALRRAQGDHRRAAAHAGGRLKSQLIGGAEYPPLPVRGRELKPEFASLSVVRPGQIPPDRFDSLFADRQRHDELADRVRDAHVLFLREHNRLAGLLAAEYPSWDDERLYATARNILIVLLIKIVIEEYINHIAPYVFKFGADPWDFKGEAWYRTNWMAIEFNLL